MVLPCMLLQLSPASLAASDQLPKESGQKEARNKEPLARRDSESKALPLSPIIGGWHGPLV